jgi:hypothetical protein
MTYQHCVLCVIFVGLFAMMTMQCIPMMPLLFMASSFAVLLHVVDYEKATIKVEVPLSNIIPSWYDISQHISVTK